MRKSEPAEDLFSFAVSREQAKHAASQTVELDLHFARLMSRLDGRDEPAMTAAARTVSAWRANGHSCVPLSALSAESPGVREILRTSAIVGGPGEWKPLILDSERLYLQRYWRYEQRLAEAILARANAVRDGCFTPEDLATAVASLGSAAADQLLAVETALTRRLCIITGGPGTGKTRTAATVLAVAHRQALRAGLTGLRVALAAPTGKAAARLTESLQATLNDITAPAELLEVQAVTLHRLLGTRPDAPAPRYHAERTLPVDLVIVDEASMIDLATMTKLLQAVPLSARLVLLGDRDQLASVDAGHVLGDLCAAAERGALPGNIVDLRRTYRFKEGSGIATLSRGLKAGDADACLQTLHQEEHGDLISLELPTPRLLSAALKERVISGFHALLTSETPTAAVNALTDFCTLCAIRRGPFGVENLSRTTERILAKAGLIHPSPLHYPRRPVMILSNDYNLRLFNGDVGVIFPDPENEGELRAFFQGSDGTLRSFVPARLPAHETAWAMTIHKSQGSEYKRVLIVLPDREGPTLTRELIYTAVSRARSRVEIWHRAPVLRAAIERTVDRASGLPDALVKGSALNALGEEPHRA